MLITQESDLLTVVLMVKNEELTVASTLTPLLEGGIRHFFIFDTGSTDATVSVCEQLLANTGVVYHLVQEPFVDFSTSRNRALALAEEVFSYIPFMLMLDAEWQLHNVAGLLRFCAQQLSQPGSLFMVRIIMNNVLDFYTPRLFRTSAALRFVGSVHEVPNKLGDANVPADIYFNYQQDVLSAEKSTERWKRDLALLLNEYQSLNDKLSQPRTVFYLAQTYECLGNLHEAYRFYKLRSEIAGWDEENFITLFRLGKVVEALGKQDPDFSWEHAHSFYLQAFALRPHRIEPLIHLADHYWPENIPLSYLYASYACSLDYPAHDLLFVEQSYYLYSRFELLSRSAWYMGKFQLGLYATEQALAARPGTPHLLSNLRLYQEKSGVVEEIR